MAAEKVVLDTLRELKSDLTKAIEQSEGRTTANINELKDDTKTGLGIVHERISGVNTNMEAARRQGEVARAETSTEMKALTGRFDSLPDLAQLDKDVDNLKTQLSFFKRFIGWGTAIGGSGGAGWFFNLFGGGNGGPPSTP